MPPTLERGNARLPTIQDVDSITVRDFAYEAFDATPFATSDGMNTPLSGSISELDTTIGTAPALDTIVHDPDKLPYTTFYDASWTLSRNQLKPSKAPTTGLPLVSTPMGPALIEPDTKFSSPDVHHRHESDNSLESEYSQYSTPPLASKSHYRGQSVLYRPMQTLYSDMEVQTLKDGSTGNGSERSRGAVVVDLDPPTTSGNTHRESSGTQSSSKYSLYSTL